MVQKRFYNIEELSTILGKSIAAVHVPKLSQKVKFPDLPSWRIWEFHCYTWCPGPDLNRHSVSAEGF